VILDVTWTDQPGDRRALRYLLVPGDLRPDLRLFDDATQLFYPCWRGSLFWDDQTPSRCFNEL